MPTDALFEKLRLAERRLTAAEERVSSMACSTEAIASSSRVKPSSAAAFSVAATWVRVVMVCSRI